MRMLFSIMTLLLVSTEALCAGPKQLAELSASDGTNLDDFGYAVAMSGNTVVVGAPIANVGSNMYVGAVYVFVKPANGWGNMTQVAKLTPSDGSFDLDFGYSVAAGGNTIVVGSIGGSGEGAAYVFVRPKSGWTDMTEMAELNARAYSVAISGDTIVAGSPGGIGGFGVAYLFLKPKRGWGSASQPDATLSPSDGVLYDEFGWAVAAEGDTVVVGAPSSGAYVFVKPESGWTNMTQTAKLTPSTGSDAGNFGFSLAIDRSAILVGAPSSFGYGNPGAFVFVEPVGGWVNATETAQMEWEESEGQGGSFANSVAISGRRAIVGEPWGPGTQNGQGEAYVFNEPKSGWQTTYDYNAALTASDDTNTSDNFGISVAMSGGRIVVGSDKVPLKLGAAYIF